MSAAGDAVGTRDPTEQLAVHLVFAFLRELVSLGDEGGLLETAYQNLSPSDWDHAYWVVFRDWTDAKESISASFVQRLVDLWQWRIRELEKDEASDRTVGREGARVALPHAVYSGCGPDSSGTGDGSPRPGTHQHVLALGAHARARAE